VATANEIRKQIAKLDAKHTEQVSALQAQLTLAQNSHSIGDVLVPKKGNTKTFTVTGADNRGLIGDLHETGALLSHADLKQWKPQA